MKTKITILLFSISFLAQIANANPVGLKSNCPRVEDLWISPESSFQHAEDNPVWTVKQIASYGTQQQWTFYLGGFHVADIRKAADEANKAIRTLELNNAQPARIFPTAEPLWVCFYDGKDLVAWAQTRDFAPEDGN